MQHLGVEAPVVEPIRCVVRDHDVRRRDELPGQVPTFLGVEVDRDRVLAGTTLTWDQGRELSAWTDTEALIDGLIVSFCDPHAPWQRPTNENTNGILRRWLPKGTDRSVHARTDLNLIESHMNTIPRRIYNRKSAQHVFDICSLFHKLCVQHR